MSTTTSTSTRSASVFGALCGPLFALAFFLSDTIARPLAVAPPTLPTDPPAAMLRYYAESGTAIMVHAIMHLLSALFLIGFVITVGRVLARVAPDRLGLARVAVFGGIAASVSLIISAGTNLATAMSAGMDEATAAVLRQGNFLSGGVVHVALLGVFAIATGLVALRARPWARGFSWLGLVSGVFSVLSLLSLAIYVASPLIPLGRFSHFVWAASVGIVLIVKRRR